MDNKVSEWFQINVILKRLVVNNRKLTKWNKRKFNKSKRRSKLNLAQINIINLIEK